MHEDVFPLPSVTVAVTVDVPTFIVALLPSCEANVVAPDDEYEVLTTPQSSVALVTGKLIVALETPQFTFCDIGAAQVTTGLALSTVAERERRVRV